MSGLNISNFIWGIADDVLRDVYVRGKYRDVILPMTVIRRLDAILEPKKEAILARKAFLDANGVKDQDQPLKQAAAEAFYNISPFTLRDLTAKTRKQQLKADFTTYLDGFSPNVQDILTKFKFRNQIDTLVEADVLGALIDKFLHPSVNLSPNPVKDEDGKVRLPGLDNHSMGTIFEELIRRFNEDNNEEAGEHFTPRDVIELMANLIFLPVAKRIESGTYLIYDAACGTGGMLTVAEEALTRLAQQHGKEISTHLFGQEVNAETYAISKADLLLKGEGAEAERIQHGPTLSADAFPALEFDFMLSNPPYGKSWKTDLERMGGKKDLKDPRFVIQHGGDAEFSLVTRSSDGQLMFLANKLAKMKRTTPLGSRIAQVHNGSSLFTGDAGSGESNIRRWVIENDWLEAIVALPEGIFYNTGIATYVWVLSNRKAPARRGVVQLIDATACSRPLRRNLGKKNCEMGPEDVTEVSDAFLGLLDKPEPAAEGETRRVRTKVLPNDAFGYWKVTVERPLRLAARLDEAALRRLRLACAAAKDETLAGIVEGAAPTIGAGPHRDMNAVLAAIRVAAEARDESLTAKREKLLLGALGSRDAGAMPLIRKQSKPKPGADAEQEALHGRYHQKQGGRTVVVEHEPDPELRDTEQVPLLEEGGIAAFIRREVLPHAPDAWVAEDRTEIGYEISFTRHFHRPKPLRTLVEIEKDILALEREAADLLRHVVGAG